MFEEASIYQPPFSLIALIANGGVGVVDGSPFFPFDFPFGGSGPFPFGLPPPLPEDDSPAVMAFTVLSAFFMG